MIIALAISSERWHWPKIYAKNGKDCFAFTEDCVEVSKPDVRLKREKKDLLQKAVSLLTTCEQTGKQQKLENGKGRKNNSMYTSSDKQDKLYTRKPVHGKCKPFEKDKISSNSSTTQRHKEKKLY